IDLDAAIHGPRVHDGHGACRLFEPLGGDAEDAVVLPHARDESHLHAFELKPQPVQHGGPLDRLLDAAEAAHAELLDAARQERIGAAHTDFGAELQEAPDVRAGDARVQDVAHETHLDALDSPVFVADGQEIEQALRGMLVLTVAGVDDVGANPVAQELGGAGGGVADDDHVDPHRFKVPRGVDEGLALLHRAAARRHVDGVGGETFFREFERDTGPRGGFKEQVDDRLAAERRDLLDGPLGHLFEGLGGIEDESDLVRREVLEPDQVLAERGGRHAGAPWRTRSTSSRPSSSSTSTSTRSPLFTLTCLPTMSGWMGSSRPPRSTSTQSEMRLGRPKSASSSSAAPTVRPV